MHHSPMQTEAGSTLALPKITNLNQANGVGEWGRSANGVSALIAVGDTHAMQASHPTHIAECSQTTEMKMR